MLCYFLSYSLNGELRDLLSEVNDRQVPKGKWHTPINFLSIFICITSVFICKHVLDSIIAMC